MPKPFHELQSEPLPIKVLYLEPEHYGWRDHWVRSFEIRGLVTQGVHSSA